MFQPPHLSPTLRLRATFPNIPVVTALGAAVVAFACSAAQATPVQFSASGVAAGIPVAAQASFTISGNTLTVVLRNTSPAHAGATQDVPGSTLTGVLFDLTGNPALLPVSALIAPGSIVQADKCDAAACTLSTTDVGGEWGYEAGIFSHDADRAIASSGYLTTGLAGNVGNFHNGAAGPNLDNPASLDGINFGIISAAAGFDPNGGLNKDPLIRDSVVFTLTGVQGLSEADISHVSFQYGTSWSEANIGGQPSCTACGLPRDDQVPEPAPLGYILGALGMIGVARFRRARRGF
jgi:hypothetical protein